MINKLFENFKEKLIELSHIGSTMSVLSWDREINIPKNGIKKRAETMAYFSGLAHDMFLDKNFENLLTQLHEYDTNNQLNENQSKIVSEVWREFEKEKNIPKEMVQELTMLQITGHQNWVKAREENNFDLFKEDLKRMVELRRKQASLIGYTDSPYDALLDIYEPNIKSEDISIIFDELKSFLIPFLQKIEESKTKIDSNILLGDFPIYKQKEFNTNIAKALGFNFESGRLDESVHPFTTHFHPEDVRITTRYCKENIIEALGSTIHEVGHGLYEQGLPSEHFGTALAESVSLGIHESQSRMWENQVGKSKPFWTFMYAELQKTFTEPFASIELNDFYKSLNKVEKSLIRVEADEVTYNLHIILRFEIEKALIEGSIEVDDLPNVWNAKIKEYLGIEVPNDKLGLLQDVHWSHGMFGYFPTYALGNLYAAQFYNYAKNEILNLEDEISKGKTEHLLYWLKKNIHQHGKKYNADELIMKVTKEPLSSKYFIEYIEKKFGEIYDL